MRISSSIHWIQEASGCNVYLVESDNLSLIDTGTSGNLGAIEDYIKSLDREIDDLNRILLTHSHLDHISSAPEIVDKTGAKTFAHELDSPYIRGEKKRGILMRIGDFFSRRPEFDVDVRVESGEEIGGFQVIDTPGHTEGSVSFFFEEEGALFVGDAIRGGGRIPFEEEGRFTLSPGIFSESEEDMKNSVEKIRKIETDLILPGHGKPVSKEITRRLDELIHDF